MNKRREKIVHIIPDQKFTMGYMNYMTEKMSGEYEHFFIIVTSGGKNEFELPRTKKIEYKCIDGVKQLSCEPVYASLLVANKIIVSGVFNGIWLELLKQPSIILKKTYLHFWGGDFYGYKNIKVFSKDYIYKLMFWQCIRKCAGVITLVPGDYKELSKIFPNNKPHFVASMPEDPKHKDDYAVYLEKGMRTNKILVGNSATKENHHLEVFKMLNHLRNDDIVIICPLAYGNAKYAKEVIKVGKDFFGERFIPLCKYQPFEKYKKEIADCSVGVFANDRQQAMGNIAMMIKMGKKLYLRRGTSMWDDYEEHGLKIYPLDNLFFEDAKELFDFDKRIAIQNNEMLRKRDREYANNWSIILSI